MFDLQSTIWASPGRSMSHSMYAQIWQLCCSYHLGQWLASDARFYINHHRQCNVAFKFLFKTSSRWLALSMIRSTTVLTRPSQLNLLLNRQMVHQKVNANYRYSSVIHRHYKSVWAVKGLWLVQCICAQGVIYVLPEADATGVIQSCTAVLHSTSSTVGIIQDYSWMQWPTLQPWRHQPCAWTTWMLLCNDKQNLVHHVIVRCIQTWTTYACW